jgi:hypothetical protein
MTDGLAEALLKLTRPLAVVIPSGTHLLASQPLMDRLLGRGFTFYAVQPIHAVAITLNPTSPTGDTIDPQRLLDVFRSAFPALPIVDVVASSGA